MNPLLDQLDVVLAKAARSADVVLAVVMAAIVGALIVPLPAWLLDVGLALNLAAAFALLIAALYARNALKVASFPTLLLATTLARLAMSVSSTRLALAEGHAGDIIEAFGEFVVRGDYVVGLVVFAILTLVQFLVVTKGAERVAEVSARFTLDAMPGKQMSIDADLRAGAIDQAQARARRRELERESQLFGAMDGAMKFVKGDVIAGLIIVLINLLGGTAVGVLQHGQTTAEAFGTYALIAIGDGLVSQLPSLCIAIAAGLVVTRVASETAEGSLGNDIGAQFLGQWKALAIVGALCAALGTLPGMPHVTFALLAAALGSSAAALRRREQAPRAPAPGERPAEAAAAPSPAGAEAPFEASGPGAAIMLDLPRALEALTTQRSGAFAKQELDAVRQRVYLETGVEVPGIQVRVGAPLAPDAFMVLIDEVPCGGGKVELGSLYAAASPLDLAQLNIAAEPVAAPGAGPAMARAPSMARSTLEGAGIAVLTPSQWVCEHLTALIRAHAAALLGVQEVQRLVEKVEGAAPVLVKEALQKVPLPLLTEVLRRLVQEEVSIKNLKGILEALVSPLAEGDAHALAEHSRRALRRALSHRHAGGGPLFAVLVDPAIEETLRAAGPTVAVDPAAAGAILEGVRKVAPQGRAVLVTSPDVRRALRRLIEGAFPRVSVLSFQELDPGLQVRPVARLTSALR